jgi:glycosyltransferase involved in cell wall biosynthesis
MKIAFHLTTPPPPLPALDAAVQEVALLRAEFGGPCSHLYPAAAYRPWIPRKWLPASRIRALEEADAWVDLHHVSSDRLFDHRALRRLRRPLVCRLLVCPSSRRHARERSRIYRAIVVSSPVDGERLRSWGISGVRVIPPGLDLGRFQSVAAPPDGPFTVMMASAPWTRRQFATKGVDALLEAMRLRPHMRLVLLWRGVLLPEIERRIRRRGLSGRVELIAGQVDVTEPLSRAHVVALATTSPRVVKAYPHSLLEGLAAGRPVLTSPTVSLAQMVRDHRCGEVTGCTPETVGAALDRLQSDFPRYQAAVAALDLTEFSIASYLRSYGDLFATVRAGGAVT